MRKSKIRLVCAVACLTLAAPLFAQYGHPLKGSWSGDWWLVKGQNNHILLDFNFVAGGYGNTTLGDRSSAFGAKNTAAGYRGSAFGYKNSASAEDSSAFGYNNSAATKAAFA